VKIEWIKRAEWLTAILLSLVILFLLIVRATHAGALWRDECGTVQLAQMSSVTDVIKNFEHQTLPPLFPLMLRLYLALFGATDASMQCFRLVVGVAFICVAWVNSRLMGHGVPLVLLALLGLNTTFLYWGGYSLTCVFPILALGLTAKLLLQPTFPRTMGTVAAAVVSVQLLSNNLVLVSAIAFSAMIACLIRGFAKLALIVAGIGLCCVASAIAYLRIYSAADWRVVLKSPVSFPSLWYNFKLALGDPVSLMPWLWYVIFLATIVGGAWQLAMIWHGRDSRRSLVLLFCILLSLAAPLAYFASFRLAGYHISGRHYLPLVGLLAGNIDLIVAQLSRIKGIRLARLGFVMAALVFFPFAAWPKIIERQTNIDLIAQKLQTDAGPNDLIVLNPWSLGVSFNWYYHGPTRWVTVPIISDHRIHRFDLIKAKMMMSFPLDDLEHEISSSLRSGNRVWFVGSVALLKPGQAPLLPLAAPDPEFGWQVFTYRKAWSQQLGVFIRRHALQAKVVLRPGAEINKMESVTLWTAEGWTD
jgi:hypothetical protein